MVLKHGFVLAPDGDMVRADGDRIPLRSDFLQRLTAGTREGKTDSSIMGFDTQHIHLQLKNLTPQERLNCQNSGLLRIIASEDFYNLRYCSKTSRQRSGKEKR